MNVVIGRKCSLFGYVTEELSVRYTICVDTGNKHTIGDISMKFQYMRWYKESHYTHMTINQLQTDYNYIYMILLYLPKMSFSFSELKIDEPNSRKIERNEEIRRHHTVWFNMKCDSNCDTKSKGNCWTEFYNTKKEI